MRESIKATLGCVVFVCIVGGFIAAVLPDLEGSLWRWVLPVGAGVLAAAAIALLIKMHFTRDLAPDFLFKQTGKYFDRDGFCFNFAATTEGGVCMIHVLFQNRYDQPSIARVAIRPARELFMRANVPGIGVGIPCPPAAFGIARVPWPIPAKYQGSRQKFEVGASVQYPQGKGRMLRFRDGIFLRASAQFQNPVTTAATVAGLAVGAIVITSPASITLKLPTNVAESIPDETPVNVATLWKLGDPIPPSDKP